MADVVLSRLHPLSPTRLGSVQVTVNSAGIEMPSGPMLPGWRVITVATVEQYAHEYHGFALAKPAPSLRASIDQFMWNLVKGGGGERKNIGWDEDSSWEEYVRPHYVALVVAHEEYQRLRNRRLPTEVDLEHQPRYARCLQDLLTHGPDHVFSGSLAVAIRSGDVDRVRATPGIPTDKDFHMAALGPPAILAELCTRSSPSAAFFDGQLLGAAGLSPEASRVLLKRGYWKMLKMGDMSTPLTMVSIDIFRLYLSKCDQRTRQDLYWRLLRQISQEAYLHAILDYPVWLSPDRYKAIYVKHEGGQVLRRLVGRGLPLDILPKPVQYVLLGYPINPALHAQADLYRALDVAADLGLVAVVEQLWASSDKWTGLDYEAQTTRALEQNSVALARLLPRARLPKVKPGRPLHRVVFDILLERLILQEGSRILEYAIAYGWADLIPGLVKEGAVVTSSIVLLALRVGRVGWLRGLPLGQDVIDERALFQDPSLPIGPLARFGIPIKMLSPRLLKRMMGSSRDTSAWWVLLREGADRDVIPIIDARPFVRIKAQVAAALGGILPLDLCRYVHQAL